MTDSHSSSSSAWIWLLLILGVGVIGTGSAWWLYGEQLSKLDAAKEAERKAREVQRDKIPEFGSVGDFAFTNFDGKTVSRESLAGKVWVVDFIFTTCTGLCPLMTGAMRELQERTKAREGFGPDRLRLVSLTTDPDVDTVDVLAAYAKKFNADPTRWHIARGPFADVQKFSQNALKLGLERATAKQISAGAEKVIHSNKFVVIDRDGTIRGHYAGNDSEEVRRLLADLAKLLAPPK